MEKIIYYKMTIKISLNINIIQTLQSNVTNNNNVKSDIWSPASYRYPISWEAFFDQSDSYFLFAEERGYHK
jgi:hypothetical protein